MEQINGLRFLGQKVEVPYRADAVRLSSNQMF